MRKARGWIAKCCGAGIFAAVLLLVFLVPAASADLSFCPPGSGAGQCSESQGIAVDAGLERVYVVDEGNNRIDVFDAADSTFLFAFGWGVRDGSAALQACGPEATPPSAACLKGLPGSGAGQLNRPRQIAVDSSSHAVYVGTDSSRVQKFDAAGNFLLTWGWDVVSSGPGDDTTAPINEFEICVNGVDACKAGVSGKGEGQIGQAADPIAVGPGGVVHVGDFYVSENTGFARVEEFDAAGHFLKVLPLTKFRVTGLAVDSSGAIYLSYDGDPGVHKLDPSGAEYKEPAFPQYPLDPGTEVSALAIGPGDTVFTGQGEIYGLENYWNVTVYDAAGALQRRFGSGAFESRVEGVAPFHTDGVGDVFASESGAGVKYLLLPPPGPIVAPPSLKAEPLSTKATLHAGINPEGKATEYSFQYVDEATYEADIAAAGPGHGFDHTKSTDPVPLGTSDFKLHHVEALAGCADATKVPPPTDCLSPETEYRFRALAENPDGKGNSLVVEGPEFTTGPSLEIRDTWSTQVGVDTARLHAEVNPLGIHATGYFQYVDEATYEADIAAAGPGHGFDHAIEVPNVGAGEAPIDFGGGVGFVTRSASLYPLAPATAYRFRLIATDPVLADPVEGPERTLTTFEKPTLEPCPANEAFRTGPSALLPDCRAYEMASPLEKNNGDVFVLKAGSAERGRGAVLSQSSTSGSRLAYGSYRAFGDARSAPLTSQYIAARGEEGWASHAISPPRGRRTVEFLAQIEAEFKAFSPDLCEAWLVTFADPPLAPEAVPGYSNLYRRQDEECGGEAYEALTTAQPPNVLPDDYIFLELQGLSADGERAIFAANDNLTEGAPAQPSECIEKGGEVGCELRLYEHSAAGTRFLCLLPDGSPSTSSCTGGSQLDWDGTGRRASLLGAFSADGTRIFWTASGTTTAPIYATIEGEPGVAVSAEAEALSGESGSRFRLAARNGSVVVFTTGEDLYEFDVETEETHLIAHKALPGLGSGGLPGLLGASEDASRIYFASTEVLTGNQQNSEGDFALAGKPNLYLYEGGDYAFIGTLSDQDVSRERSPTGGKPVINLARVTPDGLHAAFMSTARLTGYDNTDASSGKADTEVFLYDAAANGGTGKLLCASCNPSGARPAGANVGRDFEPFWAAGRIRAGETSLYATRVLSEDGNRLFFESLDALSARDTNGRQDVYEWEEAGAGGCDQGDASFSELNEGCVELISSGQSAKDSEFLDANLNGNDVFFTTLSSLLPRDYGLVDIYDARVGGGLPEPPPPPPGCEGEACQSPPAVPNDPTPASSAFEGPGNLGKGSRPRCAPAKTRRKGRCVKKNHKRDHSSRSQRRAKHNRGVKR